MKRMITLAIVLAAFATTSGCTDRSDLPVTESPADTPVEGVDPNTTGAAGSAGVGMPDTNDRGTVATDMRASSGTSGVFGGSPDSDSAIPSASDDATTRSSGVGKIQDAPNAINTPHSHTPDMNAGATDTWTKTKSKSRSDADLGDEL